MLVLASGCITIFIYAIHFSWDDTRERNFLVLLLLFFLNMMLYSSSFLSFYICLEGGSFCIFLLSSLGAKSVPKIEAVVKYFYISCISSSLCLFAISLIFWASGSLNFDNLVVFYSLSDNNFFVYLPWILLVFSLVLKLGLFPGYAWVADVAEGVTPVNYLLINIPVKFALLVFIKVVICEILFLGAIILYIGLLSYLVGLVLTLLQKKLIRFLAYGSISHIGLVFSTFILTDLWLGSFLYMVFYFAALIRFVRLLIHTILNYSQIIYITDLVNLLDMDAKVSFVFSVLEIGGFPPYNVFIFKLIFIFFLIKNNLFIISVCFLLLSVISTFYYLRLIKNLYYDLNAPFVFLMHEENENEDWVDWYFFVYFAIWELESAIDPFNFLVLSDEVLKIID